MLGDGGNDRNVLRGVGGVQQRETAAGPLDLARDLQHDEEGPKRAHQGDRSDHEESSEDPGVDHAVQGGDQRVNLKTHKDSVRCDALGLLDHVEAYERHHHCAHASDDVEDAVRDVQAAGEAARDHEGEHVNWDHVDDEHVASPRGHHVEVGNRRRGGVQHGAGVYRADPEVEDEEQREDRDTLIVVAAPDATADVARHDGDEGCRQESRARPARHLLGQEEGGQGRVRRKQGRQEDAHIADVHADVEEVQEPVEHRRRVHEPRVDGSADGAPQGVPAAVVEPVEEVQEALAGQVLGGAEVEVRIELVDHTLVADYGKEPNEERQGADHDQNHGRVHLGPLAQFLIWYGGQAVAKVLFQGSDPTLGACRWPP
mmetsp:Transcript_17093/g.65164  ORF Transcript_17093/g.65164 Transcript_17093/m.65164 type:complete len:372 (-) Transcript_17093:541-1656(-)